MDVGKLLSEFRSGTRRLGRRGNGTRYPALLRQRGAEYLRARRGSGTPLGTVARELGVGGGTLLRWAAEARGRAGAAFIPVRVTAPPVATGMVVHGPGGLRIEGLDVATLVELLRRLT